MIGEKKNARIVKRILRDSIINTARSMKMLPKGVASYPH